MTEFEPITIPWADCWNRFLEGPGPESFASVYRHLGPMAWSVCRGILGDREEVADAFQGGWARVLSGVAGLPRESQAGREAVLATFRREAERLRKQAQRATRREAIMPPDIPTTKADARATAEANLLRARVEAILGTMPESLRLPLALHYLEGLSHREVAEALGIPRTTVTSRLEKGTRRLQDALTRAGVTLGAAGLAAIVRPAPALPAAASVYTSATTATVATGGAILITGFLVMKKQAVLVAAFTALLLVAGGVAIQLLNDDSSNASETIVSIQQDVNPEAPILADKDTETPVAPVGLSRGQAAALQYTDDTDEIALEVEEEETDQTVLIFTGRVFDSNGRPVPRATVTLWQSSYTSIFGAGGGLPGFRDTINISSIQADASGTYLLESPKALSLGLLASSAGHASASHYFTSTDTTYAWFREGVPVVEKDFHLPESSHVAGRVVNEQGEPVAGAVISIHSTSLTVMIGPQGLETGATTSGEDGTFRMEDLALGRISFEVTADGYTPTRAGFPVPSEDAEIILKKGTVNLSGRVLHLTTLEGIPGATVHLAAKLPPSHANTNPIRFTTRADESGVYSFTDIPSGAFAIAAVMEDLYSLTPDGRASLEVNLIDDTDYKEVDIFVREAFTVRGRVLNVLDKSPIAGATVSMATAWVRGSGASPVVSDADGNYLFRGDPGSPDWQGRLGVSLHASREGYIPEPRESIALLDLVESETILDLYLRPSLQVSGKVTRPDGSPMVNVPVVVTPPAEVYTDNNGVYTAWGGSGSRVQASARAPGFSISYSEVVESGSTSINGLDVVMDPGGSARVRVVDESGTIISGASIGMMLRVYATRSSSASRWERAEPRPDGTRLFEGIPSTGRPLNKEWESSSADFFAHADGFKGPEAGNIEIIAGETVDVTITLTKEIRESFLSGTVVDQEGNPVAGVTLQIRHGGGGSTSARTDSAGRFRAENLPDGPYSIDISHADHMHTTIHSVYANQDHELRLSPRYGVAPFVVVDADTLQPIRSFTAIANSSYEYSGGRPTGPAEGNFQYPITRDPLAPERFEVGRLTQGHNFYIDVTAAGYEPLRGLIRVYPESGELELEMLELRRVGSTP